MPDKLAAKGSAGNDLVDMQTVGTSSGVATPDAEGLLCVDCAVGVCFGSRTTHKSRNRRCPSGLKRKSWIIEGSLPP